MTEHLHVPVLEAPIRRAAVLGAGSMGAGIAAQMANAGIEVLLYDVPAAETTPGDAPEVRSARARAGIEAQIKRRGFMRPDFAERVTPLNTEDDLPRLGEVDWIVEAVFEDIEVKAQTYARIAQHRAPGSIVSSNTSTIPLARLVERMDEDMVRHFVITHFFNPPRVMRLVEIVSSGRTDPQVLSRVVTVTEQQLGKVALTCRDTPGFIANRIGNFWMESAAAIALERGLPLELVDAVFSRPFGIPRTGVFGLFDYIGLQLAPSVWGSLHRALPADDAIQRFDLVNHPLMVGLRERGLTGRTGESGFYRGRDEVVTETFEYRPRMQLDDPAVAAKDPRSVMEVDSPGGRFAFDAFAETLDYCCTTAAEIADTIEDIDQAMVLGYGWGAGPFALADRVGLDWLTEKYRATGRQVPSLLQAAQEAGGFRPSPGTVLSSKGLVVDQPVRDGVVRLEDLTADVPVLLRNDAAVVHLLDDGVAVFNMTTPMHSVSSGVLDLMDELLASAETNGVRALVLASDDERVFSAGADLATLVELGRSQDEERITEFVARGRTVYSRLRFAPFPVVSALCGLAIGGGAELVLHSDLSVVHAEAQLGLPERTVGLLPGWGGSHQLVRIMQEAGVASPVEQAFDVIAQATPVAGAHALAARGMLHTQDRIALSADHVLAEALRVAREVAEGYTPPAEATIPRLPAGTALEASWVPSPRAGEKTANDSRILRCLERLHVAEDGQVELPERAMGELETKVTVEAFSHPDSVARAEHMASTRKPLRN
ncbi:3-hydroxyacyl-CoA dehydrogenase NAD-binding domain-containing protein [Luteococcus sp. Sow4_B9]|uniref:3-hydroxyacyl-CoA dehydrogenase/enoyl-CoA hydratase family protein n=1 Tax=Luteococcus sp. Sow4_B9 TaxID=3438792 RepID=UPI003F944A7B